jgi:RNA polymerase sigma-70 factor, ECF subfamily
MPHNSFHSETDLLHRARSGDHEAFEQLARRYSSRILATSRRILRNSADAEDNVQNVLVKACTNLHRFQEAALLSTWLTRIAINEALMKLRASAAEKHRVDSATATESAGKTPTAACTSRISPEAQCIARELAFKAVKSISPTLRDAFVLYAVEGMDSEGTVQNARNRATNRENQNLSGAKENEGAPRRPRRVDRALVERLILR